MNKVKILIVALSVLFITFAVSCSDDDATTKPEPPSKQKLDEVSQDKKETLSSKLTGTYEAIMTQVIKRNEIKGENLKLYFFVTPTITKAPDSVNLEVRNWSGDFMPHLLSFKGVVKVEKVENKGIVVKDGNNGISYSVAGLASTDDEGGVEGTFSLDEKENPAFNCIFNVFGYTMKIHSTKLRSKTVLPNANSSLY